MNKLRKCLTYSVKKYIYFQQSELVNNVTYKRYCSTTNATHLVTSVNLNSCEHSLDLIDDEKEPSVLQPTHENLSDYVKNVGPTFNFAPLVNKSPVLTDMVKLGVDLHRVEKKHGAFYIISKLDYENDFKKYIKYLSEYVPLENLGKFISKNPYIFKESIDDMDTRINYLLSKKFTKNMIQAIISRNPFWLSFSTRRIDNRLGWFQNQFGLNGNEVRKMAVKEPRLITYNLMHVEANKFSVLEEMGFEKNECKELITNYPRLWMLNNKSLMDRFNFIHLTMKIPHDVILKMPTSLYCRTSRLRERHTFLEKIGRIQYDCTKPNYISLNSIVIGTDAEFCLNVAKCSVTEFNAYLKSI